MTKQDYFKTRFKVNTKRKVAWKVISKYLQRYIRKDSLILDLGAGYCDFINNIQAKEKHALDLFNEIKKYAKGDVNVHVKDSSNMKSFKKDYFDVVFASNFFEHLTKSNLDKTFSELKRIMKKNALLIILQPNYKFCKKDYFDDYTHELIFTHISMSDYLNSKGFIVKKNIPKFLPFSLESKLPVIPLLIRLYLLSPIRPLAKQFLIIAKKT